MVLWSAGFVFPEQPGQSREPLPMPGSCSIQSCVCTQELCASPTFLVCAWHPSAVPFQLALSPFWPPLHLFLHFLFQF